PFMNVQTLAATPANPPDSVPGNLLSERELSLYRAEFVVPEEPFCDREVLIGFAANFIDTLPWRTAVARVHPLFPERVRAALFERALRNRAERAIQKFGGRLTAGLRPYGRYGWRNLVSLLEPAEVAPFARALLTVLQELGFAGAE